MDGLGGRVVLLCIPSRPRRVVPPPRSSCPARAACPGPRLPACDSGWVSRGPSVPVSLGSVGQGALRADLRLGGSPTVPSASPLETGRSGERALFLLCRSLPHCFAFDSFFSPFLLPDFGRLCLSKRAVFCRSSAGGLIGRVGPSMAVVFFIGLMHVCGFVSFLSTAEPSSRGTESSALCCAVRPRGRICQERTYKDFEDPGKLLPSRILHGCSRSCGWTDGRKTDRMEAPPHPLDPLAQEDRDGTDFKRREDSQKSTILSRTAAVFELPIRSGRNTPHPHLKPPLPPPQPPAPPSSPTLGAVVGHGGMLAGWWLVGGGVVEETRKQTTVARG
ncbi:uncharacterized protein LOC116661760 isoform X1 [Camelus ferus]|uniref:Uncharacterized protein LOC116661760 isoform X1 n=1 Tax=Camelus ferus TaxID=419612 RepID=A0A8B8SJZ3_CAMFR|nr:uncharacterized protein LOC116661760 isoform X1 [Camelus ferus]